MTRFLPLALAAHVATQLMAGTPATAQTLALRAQHNAPGPIAAGIGDTIHIDIWTRLDCLEVSGIDLHLSLPDGVFELVDTSDLSPGVQPFVMTGLFEGALAIANGVSQVPEEIAADRLHLRLAALHGLGGPRRQKGAGTVASFDLIARRPFEDAQVRVEDTPVLETRLVLPDGTTERRFLTLSGIELTGPGFAAGQVSTLNTEKTWAQVKADLD